MSETIEIIARNHEGQTLKIVAESTIEDFEKRLSEFYSQAEILSKENLIRELDNIDFGTKNDAKVKGLLEQLDEVYIQIKDKVIYIGRIIINTIIWLIKNYPNATIGLIIGLVLSWIVSNIPILGWILAPFVNILFPVIGFTVGFVADIKDKALKREVEKRVNEYFEFLKSLKVQESK